MVIELISVGTELLLGDILNTNAQFLAKECAALGYSLYYQTVIGDNEERLKDALAVALERSDIIITTGGLGPTKDDLTKETVAAVLGKKLVEDKESLDRINALFLGLNVKTIPQNNYKQALVMEGGIVLANNNGTAPGLIGENNGKSIILLPGPPNEMIPLFQEKVRPYLQSKNSMETIHSITVKLSGIGESAAAQIVDDLIENQTNPTIAPYAKTSEVHLRLTAKAKDIQTANEMIKPLLAQVEERLGKYIFTINEEETLEEVTVNLLKKQGLTLSCAESCTGGLLAGKIINVSGASQVFKEGFVTYSNEAKMRTLHVREETLSIYGAVSEETAREMALGCVKASGTDIGIATTGVAGPDGGTPGKPVGLVYIACYVHGKIEVEKYEFKGSREKIREYTVVRAVDMLRRLLNK